MDIRVLQPSDIPHVQLANITNLPENYFCKYYLYHAMSWPQLSYVAVDVRTPISLGLFAFSLGRFWALVWSKGTQYGNGRDGTKCELLISTLKQEAQDTRIELHQQSWTILALYQRSTSFDASLSYWNSKIRTSMFILFEIYFVPLLTELTRSHVPKRHPMILPRS